MGANAAKLGLGTRLSHLMISNARMGQTDPQDRKNRPESAAIAQPPPAIFR